MAAAVVVGGGGFTPPAIGDGEGIVDESQLPWGTNAVISPDVTLVSGALDVEFGDAPQIITFASVETGSTINWSPGQTVNIPGAHGLLTINPDGSWVYDVDDNVFHPKPGLTGTNDSLPDDFTMTINYVDGAGNPQTVIGNLDFEVLDDGPKLTGASIGRVVEEEALDMSAPAGAFPVLSDGNPDDFNDQFPNPDIDPESPKDASQPNSAVVSGNLGSSVIVGADSPGTWSVIGTNGLPDLYSQGDQVMYRQVGNTIEAYVERSGGDETAVEQIVFTFELQTNGDYTFTIFDQLDHVAPDGELLLADENVELRTSGPDEPVTFVSDIDFSQTIQVVDSDNDPLVLGPETLTFTMVDDVPVLSLSEIEYDGDEAYQGVLFGDVQEDALGNEDETLSTELTPYNDSSTGNLEDPPGDTDTATVDLSSLVDFSIGADQYPDPERQA